MKPYTFFVLTQINTPAVDVHDHAAFAHVKHRDDRVVAASEVNVGPT